MVNTVCLAGIGNNRVLAVHNPARQAHSMCLIEVGTLFHACIESYGHTIIVS